MRVGDTRTGVNNFFVNTIVTALQASNWERLLGRSVLASGRSFLRVPRLIIYQDWGQCYVAFADRNEYIRATT